MSEYATSNRFEEQSDEDKLFDIRFELEAMTPLQLRAEKVRALAEISEREAFVRVINEVLDGYGDVPHL